MEENHGINTDQLMCFLKKRYQDEKLAELISVEVKNAVPKGVNFASFIYRVKFVYLNASGRKKTSSIIVKTELKDEGASEFFKELQIFAAETRMYRTILASMEDLMVEVGDKREPLWPMLLGFQPYNLLAFDDLSDKGYIGTPRRNSLDFNHAKLALRNIARFHAMSKLLLARGHITADDRGRLGVAINNSMSRKGWEVVITVLTDAMVNKWGKEWADVAEKLKTRMNDIPSAFSYLAGAYDQKFEVLNHGDLWTCNLLFKYMHCEENLPISVKIIDYQVCHVNSFIWDVVHFLFSSTIPSDRRSRLNDLLTAYHQSLEKNLSIFNYSGYVPTLEDMKSEWERIEMAQLCYCMTHVLINAEATQPIDYGKMATHPPHEVVDKSIFTDGKALNSIGEDLRNLSDKGII